MQLHQWSHSPHKATGECVSAFDVAALVSSAAGMATRADGRAEKYGHSSDGARRTATTPASCCCEGAALEAREVTIF